MRALILADLHYTRADVLSERKLATLRTVAAEHKPDAVFLAGDNAEYHPCMTHTESLLDELLRTFDAPVAFVIGNHELYSRAVPAGQLLLNAYPAVASRTGAIYLETTSFQMDDWCVAGTYGHYDHSLRGKDVPLLAARNGLWSRGDRQYGWLDEKRMNVQSSSELCQFLVQHFEERLQHTTQPRITLSHTIPSALCSGYAESDFQQFVLSYSGTKLLEETLLRHKPRYHFCGHTHRFAQATIGETTVINIGANYTELAYVVFDTHTPEQFSRNTIFFA